MKTIITSTGNSLDAEFDSRFGRASWFCLFNEESGEALFYKNSADEATQGACRLAATRVKELGASRVISGHFGPNANKLLKKHEIQMVIPESKNQTIQEIVNELNPTT